MKHNLMNEYRKADLAGQATLQPIIAELQDLVASGRKLIKLSELFGGITEERSAET